MSRHHHSQVAFVSETMARWSAGPDDLLGICYTAGQRPGIFAPNKNGASLKQSEDLDGRFPVSETRNLLLATEIPAESGRRIHVSVPCFHRDAPGRYM